MSEKEKEPKNEIIPMKQSLHSSIDSSLCSDCAICAEPYNKKARLPVKCPYCDFESCRECCQKYILEQPIARCMNPECAKEWTRGFLRSSFTTKFLNKDYKEAREKILYEHEISLLPATQYLVERELQKENIEREIKKLCEKQYEIRRKIDSLQAQYNRIGRGYVENEESNAHTLYVRKCTDPECRGFLSTQWKCGVCSKWTCNKCHENLGPDRGVEHTCDPDNIATAKMIEKETKPCPNCHTNIFKIDGCDQMWCTQCNTAFSWRTGKIMLDEIHNPHYFEWLRRQQGTQQGANAVPIQNCNQRINIHQFYEYENRENREDMILCAEIYRNLVHLRRVIIPRFVYDKNGPNTMWRIEYMRKFISDDKFKTIIQQNDKKHQKNRDITNILNMLHDTVNDIIARMLSRGIPTKAIIKEHLLEVEEIVKYANECLEEVSNNYGSVRYSFNNRLQVGK